MWTDPKIETLKEGKIKTKIAKTFRLFHKPVSSWQNAVNPIKEIKS